MVFMANTKESSNDATIPNEKGNNEWVRVRKKPVEVFAIHFIEDNKDRVYHDLLAVQQNIQPSFNADIPCLIIPTLEGEMVANLGDWIILGVKKELYPCKPDIFQQTYHIVESEDFVEGDTNRES